MTMECTRSGCQATFDPTANTTDACVFHSGVPLFHEGLKSWTCCSSVNKPVTSFDDFLAIPGCTTGSHSSEAPVVAAPVAKTVLPSYIDANGLECYGVPPPPAPATPISAPSPLPAAPLSTIAPGSSTASAQGIIKINSSTSKPLEQDDPTVPVKEGTRCRRRGCGVDFEGGERGEEECWFHPGSPEFREGSKGYNCCKRRVLDFDDFLAIKGCASSFHLFVGEKKIVDLSQEAEKVECRSDFYQTPRQVHISIFGKGSSKELSTVTFTENSMTVHLPLPGHKVHSRTYPLYGPILPLLSTFSILSTKCEIILSKADARSWPSFKALDEEIVRGNFVSQLAFTSGGGRGTMGSREAVLDGRNGGV